MKTKYLVLPIVALMLGLFVLMSPLTVPVSENEGIKYDGFVCIWKNDELVGCHHNLLTTLGSNMIKTALGTGTGAYNITNITLGNCAVASQVAGDTQLCGGTTIYSANGLGPQAGKYDSFGDGQWNVSYQWTSGADAQTINATGLYNQTGAAQLFAETTFATVTLQTNDKLNVTWGLQISS